MASFFKKRSDKDKTPESGQPREPEASTGSNLVTPGSEIPEPNNKSKPIEPEKGPKKPIFTFKKKKKEPQALEAITIPETTVQQPPLFAGEPGAEPPSADAPSEEPATMPVKKSIFGSKSKKPKVVKEKKRKPPREKKEKPPRKPREKKVKPPKGEKKPLFSFGKKKKEEEIPPIGEEGAATETLEVIEGKTKESKGKEPGARKSKKAAKRVKARGGLGGSKASPVGLDLGSSSISAARLRHQTAGSVLLQAEQDSLPSGLINEGAVKDIEALAFAIKDFWKTHKIKGRKVAIGLANQKVVVRTLEFPLLEEKELRSAIAFQAQDYIPIPVEDAVFDFHVLGRFSGEDGIEKQKVLVVAAQKDMVMDFISAVKRARLSVVGVDLQAFALLRALAPTTFLDKGPDDQATAIANIGSDITNLVVDVAGEPQFTRIIAFGGDDFTKAVQDLQGVSFAEAELLKEKVGLLATVTSQEPGGINAKEPIGSEPPANNMTPPGEAMPGGSGAGSFPPNMTPPESGLENRLEMPSEKPSPQPPMQASSGEVDAEQQESAIQRLLEATADALADEIRRSLDYYMSQEQSVPIARLIISGGGAMLRNLDVHLAHQFPFSVEIGNPMLRITQNKSGLSEEELKNIAPKLAISVGLALEDEG